MHGKCWDYLINLQKTDSSFYFVPRKINKYKNKADKLIIVTKYAPSRVTLPTKKDFGICIKYLFIINNLIWKRNRCLFNIKVQRSKDSSDLLMSIPDQNVPVFNRSQ